jgi:SAM-dependent methyltransferase
MQFFVRYGKIVGNNVCRLKREAQIFPYLGRGRNMQRDGTLGYYDDHAEEFYKGTVNVAFAAMQERFLEKLEKGAYILDFGCGSGRDTKYFLERGYRVEAADGSERLCELAEEYTGIKVKHMLFQELADIDKYDGIWACSSILHLPAGKLRDVMRKMAAALKGHGIIYTSFKYGTFAGERNGRFFTDMTEETFAEFLGEIKELEVEEQWTTSDVRPGRGEEKWLNLILRKR